jgi:Cu/Ag efflux protein CusF
MIRLAPLAFRVALLAGLVFSFWSCSSCRRPSHPRQDDAAKALEAKAPSYATLPPGELGVKAYRGEGRVVRFGPDGEHVTIAHHTIPGFMSAMTMSFRVRDKQMLAGLEPGDEIEFTLEVGATSAMLTAISRKK